MNYPRTNYEMTEADLEKILDASKSVPMIMLHIGSGSRSQQDRANDAWEELGSRMGFDAMTVQPVQGKGNRFFTAIPTETETQKQERVERELAALKRAEITDLRTSIEQKQKRLAELESTP